MDAPGEPPPTPREKMLRRATTPANPTVAVYAGLEGAGTQPGAVHGSLTATEWRALKTSGAIEDNELGGDDTLAADDEPGVKSESRDMQEG